MNDTKSFKSFKFTLHGGFPGLSRRIVLDGDTEVMIVGSEKWISQIKFANWVIEAAVAHNLLAIGMALALTLALTVAWFASNMALV